MADANLSQFLGTATGDFEVADAGDSPRRVPLTDYAFQRSQYPILEELLAKFTEIADELERKTALPPTELQDLITRLRAYATKDVGTIPGEDK